MPTTSNTVTSRKNNPEGRKPTQSEKGGKRTKPKERYNKHEPGTGTGNGGEPIKGGGGQVRVDLHDRSRT